GYLPGHRSCLRTRTQFYDETSQASILEESLYISRRRHMDQVDSIQSHQTSRIMRSNSCRKKSPASGRTDKGQALAEFLIAFLLLSSFLFYSAAISTLLDQKSKKSQFPSKGRLYGR